MMAGDLTFTGRSNVMHRREYATGQPVWGTIGDEKLDVRTPAGRMTGGAGHRLPHTRKTWNPARGSPSDGASRVLTFSRAHRRPRISRFTRLRMESLCASP